METYSEDERFTPTALVSQQQQHMPYYSLPSQMQPHATAMDSCERCSPPDSPLGGGELQGVIFISTRDLVLGDQRGELAAFPANTPYPTTPRLSADDTQESLDGYFALDAATPGIGPDPHGKEITADAPWTKMDRRLVSVEVLERAGVRYEARPSFVAVLGVLGRAEIIEYMRLSAVVRRARDVKAADPGAQRPPYTFIPEDDDLADDDDNERGRSDLKGLRQGDAYPFVVPEIRAAGSPGSMAQPPKSILKNGAKTRFDEDGPGSSADEAARRSSNGKRGSGVAGDREKRRRREDEAVRGSEWERGRDKEFQNDSSRWSGHHSRGPGQETGSGHPLKKRKVSEMISVAGAVASLVALLKEFA